MEALQGLWHQNTTSLAEQTALIFAKESWTFATLKRRVDELATHLAAREAVLGAALDGDGLDVVAALACLAAGAVWCPCDRRGATSAARACRATIVIARADDVSACAAINLMFPRR